MGEIVEGTTPPGLNTWLDCSGYMIYTIISNDWDRRMLSSDPRTEMTGLSFTAAVIGAGNLGCPFNTKTLAG